MSATAYNRINHIANRIQDTPKVILASVREYASGLSDSGSIARRLGISETQWTDHTKSLEVIRSKIVSLCKAEQSAIRARLGFNRSTNHEHLPDELFNTNHSGYFRLNGIPEETALKLDALTTEIEDRFDEPFRLGYPPVY